MSDPVADRTNLSHLRHDLRTPINQIVGYSELLLEETGDAGHTAYAADLEKIRGAAKTLLNLINDNLTDERLTLAGEIVDPGTAVQPPPVARPAVDLAAPTGSQSPLIAADEPAAVPGHILIVDDTEGNRDMLARQLVRQGHTVDTAVDGRDALARLRAAPFDLVLLDMMMPVLDGWAVLRAIDVHEAPPIVVVTALSTWDQQHLVDLLELGAFDVVTKPFDPGWLVELVDEALRLDPAGRDAHRRQRLEEARRTTR